MKIEWVNHASFILEQDDVRIISDPWIEGSIFDNGWALLSKTKFQYEDYSNITHIWFSHEHPDHFYPPNIKKIPQEYREKITVLFKNTLDKKVVNYCKDLGFSDVIELDPNNWYSLSENLEIMNNPFQHDSWICYRNKDITVLNTNDCEFTNESQIQHVIDNVGNVDLLLTQFSYAASPGTKDSAKEKLRRLKLQVDTFKPTFIVPFASFVWFCHEENYYMNENINKIEDVYKFIVNETEATPVILYPGDEWELLHEHSSLQAIEKYNKDYEILEKTPNVIKTNQIPFTELEENYEKFITKFKSENSAFATSFVKSSIVFLSDYEKAVKISVKNETLEEVAMPADKCDVVLSSDSLNSCIKFPWGWDTLNINGRYRRTKHGDIMKFKKIGSIQLMNNHGYSFDMKRLGKEIVKKALGKDSMI